MAVSRRGLLKRSAALAAPFILGGFRKGTGISGYDEFLVVVDSQVAWGLVDNGVPGYDPAIDVTNSSAFERTRAGVTQIAAEPLDWPVAPPTGAIDSALPFMRDYIAGGSLAAGRRIRTTAAGVGGSSFNSGQWITSPPGAPVTNSVTRTNAAIAENPTGNKLIGILWAGGSNDALAGTSQATFLADLQALIAYLRANITGASNVPVMVTGIVHHMTTLGPGMLGIDNALQQIPGTVTRSAYLNTTTPTELLGYPASGPEHFTNVSQRAIGQIAYTAWTGL